MKVLGFSIVELVVIIVIVALLSFFALPRLLSLREDALKSTLESGLSSIKSANDMVYAKAAIENKENLFPSEYHNETESFLIINGRRVDLSFGKILATKWNIETVTLFPPLDWKIVPARLGHFGLVYLVPRGAPSFTEPVVSNILSSNCYISYGFERYDYHNPRYVIAYEGC